MELLVLCLASKIAKKKNKPSSTVAAFKRGFVTWTVMSVIYMCVSEFEVLKIAAVPPRMANSSGANPLEEIFI